MHTFCKIKGGSNLVPRGRATLVQPNVGRSVDSGRNEIQVVAVISPATSREITKK